MDAPTQDDASRHVVLLTTGGTIAAATAADGTVTVTGDTPLDRMRSALPAGVRLTVRAVCDEDSSRFGPAEVDAIVDAVHEVLGDPGVDAVVLSHGTDTLEETALALDLQHDDPRPVVLTGAQRAADHPESDGPANLLDAVLVASDAVSRDLGVLVVFGRAVLQARGVRKWHTEDLIAFSREAPDPETDVDPDTLPAGLARPVLPRRVRTASARVDVVCAHPGTDDAALRAAVAAGAAGLVVEGLGSGNVPPAVAAGLLELMSEDPALVVVVTTRVPRGSTAALYAGPGGGAELARAGVLSGGRLRSGQARVLLQGLLALHRAEHPEPRDAAAAVRRDWESFARVTA